MQPVAINILICQQFAACGASIFFFERQELHIITVSWKKQHTDNHISHTWWYRTMKEHATDLVRGLRPQYHGHELLARVPYNADCYDLQSLGKIFVRILPQLLNQLFAAWNCHFRTHLRHNCHHCNRAHVFPPCWIRITAYPQCSRYTCHLPSIKTHSGNTAGNFELNARSPMFGSLSILKLEI